MGQRLDECKNYCERAAKRLKKKTRSRLRSSEGAESTRRGVGRRETSFGSSPIRSHCSTSSCPGTHSFRNRVDASPKSCGRLAREKISAETNLKQRIDLLLQEVARLKVRMPAPASGSGATKMVLVPVSKSGSALMSDLIEEADKKRPWHGEGAQ